MAQTLRGKKKEGEEVSGKKKKLRATYEKDLGSSHSDNVVSLGICFWHLQFEEKRAEKKMARNRGRTMAHDISKGRTPSVRLGPCFTDFYMVCRATSYG